MFDDDQQTPNVLTATFGFDGPPKKMLVFEVRHWISNPEAGVSVGNIFYGSKGYLVRKQFGYRVYSGKEQVETVVAAIPERHGDNFIAAVRSRRREDLNAEIEEGAATCTLIHLANISYRLGRTLRYDAKSHTCVGDPEANRMLTRQYRKPYVVPERV
jgi:hypothetical protein